MPDEKYFEWKRKEEDSRDRDRKSPIYDDDAETKSRVFNFASAFLLFFIIVVCILVPMFGLAYGVLDVRFYPPF